MARDRLMIQPRPIQQTKSMRISVREYPEEMVKDGPGVKVTKISMKDLAERASK